MSKPDFSQRGTLWGIESLKMEKVLLGINDLVFDGKKILWMGTSIPAQCTYPQNACLDVGATVTNVALASSCIRRQSSDGTFTGMSWQKYCYSLSQTSAEKEFIIANWSTIRTSLISDPPLTLDASAQAIIRNSSYEVKLTPYLDYDLFVFDHGVNDVLTGEPISDFKLVPSTFNNRDYFVGAMNYLIDLILTHNPKAKIAVFGFYENTSKPQIYDAQKVVADYWQIPICETWRYTRWSNKVINGVPMIQNWFPDGLHPHGDLTGDSDKLLDRLASNFLRTIV